MTAFAHKVGYMIPMFLTVIALITTFVFNGLAASGPNAVFLNSTGETSDAYYLEITPAGWTFSIWGIIYAWQCIWIIYGLSTICRKGVDGYLYYSPPIMPPAIYAIYIINLACNVTWLILWDREYLPAALVVIALIPVTLAVCLFISYRAILINYATLLEYDLSKEIWWIRWAVQNGLAFYATWTCIATLLNFAMVLTYWADMEQSHASTVALSVLAAEIVGWFILDIFVVDKYGVRYTFSPYIVIVWALSGSLEKNYEAGAVNSIFTLVLLITGSLALVAKIIIMIIRHIKHKGTQVTSVANDKLNSTKHQLCENQLPTKT